MDTLINILGWIFLIWIGVSFICFLFWAIWVITILIIDTLKQFGKQLITAHISKEDELSLDNDYYEQKNISRFRGMKSLFYFVVIVIFVSIFYWLITL